MKNEIILIISLIFIYSSVLLWYKLFGKTGLIAYNVMAGIAANIEVLILIQAFGMEQTLGNILFASTFLVTDILSEKYGKKAADSAVYISILSYITFVVISQSWLLYSPAPSDFAQPLISAIFSSTARLMISSIAVYAIVQKFDVWLYHKWWQLTERLCGDSSKFLWLRNNGSTLISQLLNTVLFTFAAFAGTYDLKTIFSIVFSSYVIFIFTSLLDTPVIYIARKIKPICEKNA